MWFLLLACSDYDLQAGKDHAGRDLWGIDTSENATGGKESSPTTPHDSGSSVVHDHPEGKVDVVLLIDVAYVYDCYHADLPVRTRELTAALLGSGADVSIAIASFDDYNVDGELFSRWGGLPYILEQQLTNDQSLLDGAASRLTLEWGGDGQGSGFEAVYQSARGKGYDQDCDTKFDSAYDIKPFSSSNNDAFDGNVGGIESGGTPGTGSEGGVGFRSGSKRVFVLITENSLRDKSYGHPIPTGACLGVASRTDAADAIQDMGGKFLGVNAYEFQDIDTTPQDQLEDLAQRTSSKIDADRDGQYDDVAVLSGSWDWPPVQKMVQGIWDLAR